MSQIDWDASKIAIITGKAVPRVDGPLKVSGQARYTSDHSFPGIVYAVPVGATIARGTVKRIDASAAEKMRGVLRVFTRQTIGPLYRPTAEDGFAYRIAEPRPPLEDDVVRYYGQYIAVVVAETFELAQVAARSLKVTYTEEKPNVDEALEAKALKKVESQRGDAAAAFAGSAARVDQTYVTPVEVHNPIELHATVAHWTKDSGTEKVTLYETSQSIGTHRNVMAQILGLPKESVRVITEYLGSGFGGKLWPWPHSALAAAASRQLNRPVKLVIDRKMMFMNVGYRPRTQQRVQLGASSDGKLQALSHTYATQGSMLEDYKENCGEVSSFLYGVPNVLVSSGIDRRNQGVPTAMRGPGAVPGLYALESAMDELAVTLKMDPVALRLLNDTPTDGSTGKPFSSRHLAECLKLGAKNFGWEKRTATVGSMRDGEEILGWGVSACTWAARRLDADATVEFRVDGKVRVSCGTHDVGTGMYTVLAQLVHDETGVPMNQIEVVLGDTDLPPGPIAGGSMATASVVPAALEASRAAIKNLLANATKIPQSPFFGRETSDLHFTDGKVKGPKGTFDFPKLLQRLNMNRVAGSASIKGNMNDKTAKVTAKSFGAQFVEIGWNPLIARLRVRRVVSVIDGGRIINYQPAMNQIEGAIVMGVGMGLFEQAEYDSRYGHPVNSNLADYVMPVHADCPEIDVTFLDYPDKSVNEYGARGVGEIGLAGIASSITSAVYHATGVRVRELPVMIEDLLPRSGSSATA